jgi:hypothetical protein
MRKPVRRTGRRYIEEDDDEGPEGAEERFDKAFFIAIGIFAVFFPVIFVPVMGLIIVLTLAPYLAGYLSGKYINKKDGILIAIITGIIWSLVEIWILFSLLSSLELAVGRPGIHTSLDWLIVFIVIIMNIAFCTFGSYFTERKVHITVN